MERPHAAEGPRPVVADCLLVCLEDDYYDAESVQIDKIEQRMAFHPSLMRERMKSKITKLKNSNLIDRRTFISGTVYGEIKAHG